MNGSEMHETELGLDPNERLRVTYVELSFLMATASVVGKVDQTSIDLTFRWM